MQDFVEEQGLTFTILVDEEAEVARVYQVRGIPRTFFIDEQGMIRASNTGPVDEALVDEILALMLR